jgi:hypothetical protein
MIIYPSQNLNQKRSMGKKYFSNTAPYYQSIVKDKKTLQALYDYCKKLPATPIQSASIEGLCER